MAIVHWPMENTVSIYWSKENNDNIYRPEEKYTAGVYWPENTAGVQMYICLRRNTLLVHIGLRRTMLSVFLPEEKYSAGVYWPGEKYTASVYRHLVTYAS